MADAAATTRQKALALNLDATTYGTFAEIGGGQEVARWFFSVGGAAGTVAKTISAYDMAVSDALYGPRQAVRQPAAAGGHARAGVRPVARRCWGPARGDAKRFFAFADTVATRGYQNAGQRARLARRPVPGPAARGAVRDHRPRPPARLDRRAASRRRWACSAST